MKVITDKRNGAIKEEFLNTRPEFNDLGTVFYSTIWDGRKNKSRVIIPTSQALQTAKHLLKDLERATGSTWCVFEDSGNGWAEK